MIALKTFTHKKRAFYYIIAPLCYVFPLVIIYVLSACASSPKTPPPDWVMDIESVFPMDTFLAEKGSGKSAGDAEIAGSRAIASYISTQVTRQLTEEARFINNGPTEIKGTDITAVVTHQELPPIRYTAAWYNKGESKWETVAYINRDEAWNTVYEPDLKPEKNAFLNMYAKAENERDPIRRYAIYQGTQNSYTQNYARRRAIATRINTVRAGEYFADVDRIRAELPHKLDDARLRAVILINCNNDYENRITQAFEKSLSNAGFRIAKNRAEAAGIFAINVNWNETTRLINTSESFEFTPTLSASLTSTSGILFSYNSPAIPRVATIGRDVGLRRASTALAAEVENSFLGEFRKRLASFAGD